MKEPQVPMWQQWAQFRHSVIGELLSCPPDKGRLQQAVDRLARKTYQHPIDPNRQIRLSRMIDLLRLNLVIRDITID